MGRADSLAGDVLDWVDDAPIVFAGRPEALRGQVRVRNAGDVRVALRRGRIVPSTGDDRLAEAVARAPEVARLRSFSLRPHETRLVPLSARLDRFVPPGEYPAEVEVGGLRRPAVLHVLEDVRLSLEPRKVVVPNRPGERVDTRVVARNDGNVPLEIGDVGAVVLDDDVLSCRILRRALAEFDETEDDYETFLTEVVRQAKKTLEEVGPLRVANASGAVTLQPGDTAALELRVSVPRGLDRHSRYLGSARVHRTSLQFVVAPTGPQPRARRSARR